MGRSLAARSRRAGARSARAAQHLRPLISATQLVAGPLLALGLFTRLAALPIVVFLMLACVERWRVGRYFWNTFGVEYTLLWTIAAFYFLVNGGGELSFDRLLLSRG